MFSKSFPQESIENYLPKSLPLGLGVESEGHAAMAARSEWWQSFVPQSSNLKRSSYLFVKRLLDVLIIVASSPVLLLIFGLCIIFIKVDAPRATVFFKQERTGKDGKRFAMLKFRTMVPNAEELKQEYQYLNELAWPDFKITNDPRITRIGRILRKTSLDELPQIINVLRGEMTLVGPRPTSFAVDTYHLWHTVRLDVTPGLTGLWQIIGRGEMEFDERVRLDYEYIQRRSITFDLMILFRTFFVFLKGK